MRESTYKSNHVQEIFLQLNKERKTSKTFCDVTLKAGLSDFASHKCILGMFSHFFNKMFITEMREKYESKATIQGVDADTMETILNFMYTCDVTITSKNVYGLLEAANYMAIPYLKKFCVEFLLAEIDASNCMSIRKCAKFYGLNKVVEKANTTLLENFEAVVVETEFKDLKFEDVCKVMQFKERIVSSEEVVYVAIMNWTKHGGISRHKYVSRLFSFIQLEKLSLDFLHDVVENESLIMNSNDCLMLLFQSTLSRYRTENIPSVVPQVEVFGTHFFALDSNLVWKYNTSHKKVAEMPKTNVEHHHGSLVFLKNKIFAFGGISRGNEVLNLNDEKQKWIPIASCKNARIEFGCALYNDSIFFVGGYERYNQAERYDIARNKWYNIADLPLGRFRHALVAHKGFLFAIGGLLGDDVLNSVQRFDIKSGSWSTTTPMKIARCYFPAVVLNNLIYAVGGYRDKVYLKSVECYNPDTGKWTDVASLNIGRSCHGACVVHGKIYVAGGSSEVVEVYDPVKNTWTIDAKIYDFRNLHCLTAA